MCEVIGKTEICKPDLNEGKQTLLKDAADQKVLHEFACWCAERSLLLSTRMGYPVDPASYAAIEAKRQWLRGEISSEQLREAADAADAVTSRAADLAGFGPYIFAVYGSEAVDRGAFADAYRGVCAAAGWAACDSGLGCRRCFMERCHHANVILLTINN